MIRTIVNLVFSDKKKFNFEKFQKNFKKDEKIFLLSNQIYVNVNKGIPKIKLKPNPKPNTSFLTLIRG